MMTHASGWMEHWKARARALKTELHALLLACRDPRVPWRARITAALVLAYAVSPIDLIPDFIPVLGYLDDLILLPLGILLTVRMIPADVMRECRARAGTALPKDRSAAVMGGIIVVGLWAMIIVAVVVFGNKMMAW